VKTKHAPKPVNKLKRQSPFEIPHADWPHEKELTEIVSSIVANKTAPRREQATATAEVSADYLGALVSIANNFWRARKRMSDAGDGEVREDMKRIHDRVEAIRRSLVEVGIVICYHPEVRGESQPKTGIVIRDHTGDAYDEGQPMKVVASKPTPGLDKKRVSETLLPSIFWNNRLVQNGEIEIATPVSPNSSAESQPHQP
jgi:hypothetical protein